MFWNRNPKCPIIEEDKEWVETHLDWIDQNVVRLVDQQTILPTRDYFDWEFNGDEKDAAFLLRKVGAYYGINTDSIDLDFYSEESIELDRGLITQREDSKGTAGLYVQRGENFSIFIEVQQLARPQSLIATLSHELSHFILFGQHQIELEGEENEWLTDLLTIAYGFGIFLGNSKFEFSQWQSGDGWGGWQYSSQGYLPQEIIAYVMASIEVKRTNVMPGWIGHLKKDFGVDFKKSMKYLIAESGKSKT